jgi:hypothetical protein
MKSASENHVLNCHGKDRPVLAYFACQCALTSKQQLALSENQLLNANSSRNERSISIWGIAHLRKHMV